MQADLEEQVASSTRFAILQKLSANLHTESLELILKNAPLALDQALHEIMNPEVSQ